MYYIVDLYHKSLDKKFVGVVRSFDDQYQAVMCCREMNKDCDIPKWPDGIFYLFEGPESLGPEILEEILPFLKRVEHEKDFVVCALKFANALGPPIKRFTTKKEAEEFSAEANNYFKHGTVVDSVAVHF